VTLYSSPGRSSAATNTICVLIGPHSAPLSTIVNGITVPCVVFPQSTAEDSAYLTIHCASPHFISLSRGRICSVTVLLWHTGQSPCQLPTAAVSCTISHHSTRYSLHNSSSSQYGSTIIQSALPLRVLLTTRPLHAVMRQIPHCAVTNASVACYTLSAAAVLCQDFHSVISSLTVRSNA